MSDIQTRESLLNIVNDSQTNNKVANVINQGVKLYLEKYNNINNFVDDLEQQDFMSEYLDSEKYDLIIASIISTLSNFMKYSALEVEDYEVEDYGMESYHISMEGMSTIRSILNFLKINPNKAPNSLPLNEQIRLAYQALKKAIADKYWKLVVRIRMFIAKKKLESYVAKDIMKTKKAMEKFNFKDLSDLDQTLHRKTKAYIDEELKNKNWHNLVRVLQYAGSKAPDLRARVHRILLGNNVKYGRVSGMWQILD